MHGLEVILEEHPFFAGFTPEQKEYLSGLFAGAAMRGKSFADAAPAPAPPQSEDLILEERLKRELHPLDAYERILENAIGNKPPDKEDVFRFKWNGLFFLTPMKDAFMARLRIPGGAVTSHQLRELAHVAQLDPAAVVEVPRRPPERIERARRVDRAHHAGHAEVHDELAVVVEREQQVLAAAARPGDRRAERVASRAELG